MQRDKWVKLQSIKLTDHANINRNKYGMAKINVNLNLFQSKGH